MDLRRFGHNIVLRLDKGDEIVACVLEAAKREGITLASVSGLGGSDNIDFGVWNGKAYDKTHLEGFHEITSLMGMVNTMGGEPYQHLHITCAGGDGSIKGGHLLACVISLTGEIVLREIDGTVDRRRDESLGINVLDF